MMAAINALLGLFILPLMLINGFGGVVAFVWLAISGQWRMLITGIVATLFGLFLLPLIMAIGSLIAAGMAMLVKRSTAVGVFAVTLANIWIRPFPWCG